MEIRKALKLQEAIKILDKLDQTAPNEKDCKRELIIGKNDPKDMKPDYWWLRYGNISMSGYYFLTELLIDFAKEIEKNYPNLNKID